VKKENQSDALPRIAATLEKLADYFLPKHHFCLDDDQHMAYLWEAHEKRLIPVSCVNHIKLELIKGIDRQLNILLENTRQFTQGFSANNVLLWGARGVGKSSAIKAVHAAINNENASLQLGLIEIFKEDLASLPYLLQLLAKTKRRFILFCDDISFEASDDSYKFLKVVLDGGLQGRPNNVIFYATSNRRHIIARNMQENIERNEELISGETAEEKLALSDRFGLWIGLYAIDQETYFAIVKSYANYYQLNIDADELVAQAHEWAMMRGARSGRVAFQFIEDLAGKLGKKLSQK